VVITPRIDGQSAIWVRDLDGLAFRMLLGTEGANSLPFWSPDSRWIGFFADGKLKKIDVTGGPAITLCDVPNARGGSWNREGVIIFAQLAVGVFRLSAAGGAPTQLTKIDIAAGEVTHRAPWFLPDGRHFLYTARHNDEQNTRIYVDTIDTKPEAHTRREVLVAASNAVYAPPAPGSARAGWLLFSPEDTLKAQPFDAANAKTMGDAVPVAEKVDYMGVGMAQGQFSASANGTLVYLSGALGNPKKQLTWFDRSGNSVGAVGAPADIQWAALSPDGSTLAMDRPGQDGGSVDIWLRDLARGTESRLTFGPGNSTYPVWSPDGRRVAWYSWRDLKPHAKASNGVGNEETLFQARLNRVYDWSRDGRYLIDYSFDEKSRGDIWVIPLFGDRKPFAWLATQFQETDAKLSPNNQWLAYVSDESRRREVYVQTFPEHKGKWQISTTGGDRPVWSRDGRELYFISADNKMMAAAIKGTGTSFQASVPKALFPVPAQEQYDVSKDGRFLIHVPVNQNVTGVPITVVKNWQAGLKTK
jgi:Tol biopolymer transport system component